MNRNLISVVSSLTLAIGLILSPGIAMDEPEQSGKRKSHHAQLHDDSKSTHRITKPRTVSNVTRISTPQDHMECLRDGISRATKSILITSYGVDHDVFVTGNLYPLLTSAKQRGVNIYIYNIDSKDTDQQTSDFFKSYNIAYDEAFTHAKIFAVDNSLVTIGSYNWLSRDNSWENATLRLSGRECADLIPLLWEDLKYYRNLQFGNLRQIKQYERDPDNTETDTWELDNSTELHYIHSLESHREFIADAFESAERKIIFCAPFVNKDSGYQRDFTKKLLNQTLCRNVHIYFVCRTDAPTLPSFRHYLGTLLDSPFMHIITMPNIHLKTVVIDDETIAEGSFNWLSASRDEESEFHNHEVTLLLDGSGSQDAIQNFYASPVGLEILRLSSSQETILETEVKSSSNESTKREHQSHTVKSAVDTSVQRRTEWLSLDWKISAKGNSYVNVPRKSAQGTHNIVILKSRENSYSAVIDTVRLEKWYRSEDEAKLAARNHIESN